MQLEPLNALEIGKRLYMLRTNSKLRQAELSSIFGIAQGTLSNYERGGAVPRYEILIAYTKYFHVSLEYLLCLDSEGFDLSVLPNYEKIRYGNRELTDKERERLMALLSMYKHPRSISENED